MKHNGAMTLSVPPFYEYRCEKCNHTDTPVFIRDGVVTVMGDIILSENDRWKWTSQSIERNGVKITKF